jgi:hypothetical protein
MGMLNAFADADEQSESVRDGEATLVTMLGNGQSRHILHDEVGLSPRRRAGLENLGDEWMIHGGERLPLRAKSLHQALVVQIRTQQRKALGEHIAG